MDNVVRLDVKMKEEEAFFVYGILKGLCIELSNVLEGKTSIEQADKLEPDAIKAGVKGMERITDALELVLEV